MIVEAHCSVEGCVNPRRASGLCARHYRLDKYQPGPTKGVSNLGRRRRELVKDHLSQLKLKIGCVDCGYKTHAQALEFDHLPGTLKKFNLSRAGDEGRSWDAIEDEIAKCEVVCANCHRVRTASRRSG